MDFIIIFYRDILNGPLYIVVVVICIILICSCIGYLAETSINKNKLKSEYEKTHGSVSDSSNVNPLEQVQADNSVINQQPVVVPQTDVQNNVSVSEVNPQNSTSVMPNAVVTPSQQTPSVVPPIGGVVVSPPNVINTVSGVNEKV